MTEKPTLRRFLMSKGVALFWTIAVELVVLTMAVKDPLPWVAEIQYALLFAPPIILAFAIRDKSYDQVLSRVFTVFAAAATLDLLHLR
jgi:hypothetical protein